MAQANKQTGINRFLNIVERLGNILPNPVVLFLALIIALLLLSAIGAYFDVSVIDPRPEGTKGRAEDGMIRVVNLLNGEGLAKIVTNLVSNFTGFAPLGTALVALLGVGVAEKSGLISSAMRAIVLNAPKRLVTLAVVFAGVMSNIAAELGYVVIIPLAAMVFYSLGRHPLAGIAAAFSGVSGGYAANLLIGTIDPVLAGITQASAQLIAPDYTVGAQANWYFMAVSTFLISGLGFLITDKLIEPRLGAYDKTEGDGSAEGMSIERLNAQEKKGLWAAFATVLVLAGLIAAASLPEGAPLRNPETGELMNSPLMSGIVALIFVFFALSGLVYGKVAGTLKTSSDVVDGMVSSMRSMAIYLTLIFFVSQFVAYFGWSNLGPILAVKGSEFLKEIGLSGGLLFVFFVIICGMINLMIASSSAQWAVTAPIFVPMLMLAGYAPEMIQAAYRIGDSVTNIITPMMPFFALTLSIVIRYKKDAGVGTLVSLMLPYSIAFAVGWMILFYVWVFVLGWPVGPGSATYYRP